MSETPMQLTGDASRNQCRPLARAPLFWRVFATDALVLTLATAALALSPAAVSFPVAPHEGAVLALGLGAMVAFNFALLRRALSPLEACVRLCGAPTPWRPGARAPVDDAAAELRAGSESFTDMVEPLEAEPRESADFFRRLAKPFLGHHDAGAR